MSANIAKILCDFKQKAGPSFLNESVDSLVTKYMMYRLYPDDWAKLYSNIYNANGGNSRVVEQIADLQKLDRSKLCQTSAMEVWKLMSMLQVPEQVDPKTMRLKVRNRRSGFTVPHYAAYKTSEPSFADAFTGWNDKGFLLALADEQLVSTLLIDPEIRMTINRSATQIQYELLPQISEFAEKKKAQKMTEVVGLMKYCTVQMSNAQKEVFIANGLSNAMASPQEVLPTKRDMISRLAQGSARRDKLLEMADEDLLHRQGRTLDEVSKNVDYKTGMTKADVEINLHYLGSVIPDLEKSQMTGLEKRRRVMEQIKEADQHYNAVHQRVDAQKYYADSRSGDEYHFERENCALMEQVQLERYRDKIRQYVAVLEQYVTEDNIAAHAQEVGFF